MTAKREDSTYLLANRVDRDEADRVRAANPGVLVMTRNGALASLLRFEDFDDFASAVRGISESNCF